MKHEKTLPLPLSYEQPVLNFKARSLSGSREYVDFIPESHLRIWYNTQTEGYANHYHNAMEIIVCAEDQYFITTGSRTYTLVPGDILIIPPTCCTSFKASLRARGLSISLTLTCCAVFGTTKRWNRPLSPECRCIRRKRRHTILPACSSSTPTPRSTTIFATSGFRRRSHCLPRTGTGQ